MKLNPPTASRDFIRPKGGFHRRRRFIPPARVDLVEKNGNRITITVLFWQRMRDSNPRKRSQSPVCYRYTNPLFSERLLLYAKKPKSQAFFSILFSFFLRCVRCLSCPKRESLFLPGERFSLQNTFPQITESYFLALVPEHSQKIFQLPASLDMHQ